MRPFTLLEVSERIDKGADPVKEFSEFLDHFYDKVTNFQMVACLEEEPILLKDGARNALFAAAAEYLSKRYQLSSVPEWVNGPQRKLREPWFTTPDEGMKEYLIYSSPAEFRSRNIFTEAVPLRRARTWQAEERLQERMTRQWERDMTAAKLRSQRTAAAKSA
jgi:hypothetical protein